MATVNLPAKQRIFTCDAPEYITHLTEKGRQINFYKGYFVTEDKELADFASTIPGVTELKDTKDVKIPTPPARNRTRNLAYNEPIEQLTTISMAELMQRSVGSTATTPQASASNSTNS